MPRAFSEREKQMIQARLLEEGRRVFATQGFKKTSIEVLTESAGISKGAFYSFYTSKEALFMDVLEAAEADFRLQVLAAVNRPGPSSRARLKAILMEAFSSWKRTPVLATVNRSTYDLLLRKLPMEKVQEHLGSDRRFIEELAERCRQAGIPVKADAALITGLMKALFLISLHEDDFGPDAYPGMLNLLLDLTAAYWLGEVPLP